MPVPRRSRPPIKTRQRRRSQDGPQAGDARIITGNEAGTDLAHYLADTYPAIPSVRQVRRLLSEGRCRVGGKIETFGSRKLRKGEVVEFRYRDSLSERRERTEFEPERLLLDADGLVAYDKPPRLAVTPTEDGKQWDLLHLLRRDLGDLLPVHRIDADTTGIVILARERALQQRMEELFRSRQVSKQYKALVRGHPREDGERRSYLVRKESQPGFEKWGSGKGQGALSALTTWTVERRFRHGSMVRVEPLTGRYHQIRIHFAEMGCPLYGDHLYGDRQDPIDLPRHMLHAARIEFPHPVTDGATVVLKAPLPADFRTAIEQVEKLK